MLKDARAVNAMVGAMTTGNAATCGLASFGRVALEPVLVKLNSADRRTRLPAVIVLSEMLDPSNIGKVSDPVSKAKIKEALVKAAANEDPFVRIGAIDGLSRLPDPDVIPLLEKLAQEDPYESSMHGGDKGHFPARNEAKRALATLKSGKPKRPSCPQ